MSDDDEATNDGDEHGGVHPPPSLPVNQGPPFIAFSVLLDFAVQKAYQDLTILTELLPKKSDLERKTSIAQFASSTRQLFVRILAVLKWARCGAKVDMCTGIQCFLDQQASMFVDTADRLFQMCNSVLNNARLPTFQMPIAVDVLTLGTFPRLPKAIQQRFIPPEKITIDELRSVTRRLSQVVQRRVTSVLCSLPERMRNFTVKDGMVTFRVIGEFEATLTLLGQLPATPWTLLNFRLLVTDPRVTDGSELLNSHQTVYLHHYLQARMNLHKEPLTELYNLLHGFSLSVQLDLLCCQAGRLLNDYLSGNLAVDEYVRSQRLVVSYWRDASKGGAKGEALGGAHKLVIHVDPDAPERRLQVTHVPKSDLLLPGLRTGDRLSLEDLLSDTVLCRIRYRLGHLMDMIRGGHLFHCAMEGRFPKLRIALLDNCTNDEMLYISINLFSGRFLVRISVLRKNMRCRALEDSLNKGNWTALNQSLLDLRVALVTSRYVRTNQLFHTSRINHLLPAVDQTFALKPNGQRLVIQISRCEHFCLVIDFAPGEKENPDTVNVQYWVLIVGRAEEEQTGAEERADTAYYIERMELDEERIRVAEVDAAGGFKCPPHYVRRMGSLLAIVEQEAPFMALMRSFNRHGVRYRSPSSAGHSITTLDVIGIDHGCLSSSEDASLLQSILDVASKMSVRLQYDRYKIHWTFELRFFNSPLRLLTADQVMQPIRSHQTSVTALQSSARSTYRIGEDFLNMLRSFAMLHGPVVNLAEAMHFWPERFSCLRIIFYTYHKLMFAYGPSLRHVCSVNWRSSEGAFALLFAIRPDALDGHSINPHTLLAYHLQQWFQRRQDLVALVTVLNASLVPMVALASLPVTIGPLLTDNMQLSTVNTHVFCVIPLSPFCVRLVYKGRLALEITFLPDDQVSVRDCAPALGTQASRFMPKYVPIVGLKTFLGMHSSGVKRWQNMADGDHQQQQQGGDPVAESSSSVGISTPPEDWTASAAPIVVKHSTLTAICAPSNTMPKPEWSAIHKFLASVALLDLFKDQSNASVPRPGQLCMKLPQLELRFFVEETSLSWIALKIYVEENNDICTEADAHFLERYFATYVSPLYSYSALTSFLRILSVCKGIRRDLFANLLLLMNMQLNRYPEEGVFWLPEICFQVPPMHLLPPMLIGVVKVTQVMNTWPIVNNPTNKKILFWIKFTRVENRSHCLVFPLLYDGDTNALQIFRGGTQPTGGPAGTLCAVDACLIRQHQVHQNYGDCSFWASIRDVMHTNDLLALVNG